MPVCVRTTLNLPDALAEAVRARSPGPSSRPTVNGTAASWSMSPIVTPCVGRTRRRRPAVILPDVHVLVYAYALIAAMAGWHGCCGATADRGFARFDGIEWLDPAAGAAA